MPNKTQILPHLEMERERERGTGCAGCVERGGWRDGSGCGSLTLLILCIAGRLKFDSELLCQPPLCSCWHSLRSLIHAHFFYSGCIVGNDY